MKYFISHRGNIYHIEPDNENKPFYVKTALESGYDCEIDLRYIDGKYFLGHDGPQDEVDETFLKMSGLWVHCKTIETLQRCLELNLHCFFHQTDEVTLTSRNFIWTYPGKAQTKNSIIVLPELDYGEKVMSLPECAGICSDVIWRYKHNGN